MAVPPAGSGRGAVNPLVLGLGSACLLAVPGTAFLLMPVHPLSGALFGLLALLLAAKIAGVWWSGTTGAVRGLVGAAILGIVLLDAGMVASVAPVASEGFRGFEVSLPGRTELAGIVMVASLILPAWAIRRRIEVA